MCDESKKTEIEDHGGTRTGADRRKTAESDRASERRTGRDRRKGFDRRSDLGRRRGNERRNSPKQTNIEPIERRDVFRSKKNSQTKS